MLGITIVAVLGSGDRNRLKWLLLAIALMFASAICALMYLDAVGRISGWIELPKYEGDLSTIRWRARLWSFLAVIFPFLAALFLEIGKGAGPGHIATSRRDAITAPDLANDWTMVTAVLAYLLRVAVSTFASLAFMLVLVLLVSLLEKFGVRVH
jgi:hypothetical protein